MSAKKIKKPTVQVIRDAESVGHVFASEIRDISKAVRDFRNQQVKDKTILVLLAHSTGLSQTDCKRVLDALETLERDYLK